VEREARKRLQISSCKLIPHARIPLLKLETSSGTELDVSINDASGVSAANFLQSWVRNGPQWFGLALCASSSEA
jgi:DNA polymerase sigma